MHNENDIMDKECRLDLDELKKNMHLLRKQLFSDDITESKNRLWVLKEKLNNNETFNDFGFLVSIKISDHGKIVKEYDSNVGNRLLKQVSDYMIRYMKDNHINYEIVRYMDDNFLIFIYDLTEDEVEEHIVNMQNGMSNYKFKHRSRMFQLTSYSAVMQYIEHESFSSVLDQLDEKLFENKV
ncbi:diguanylate cyclase domain-containing protein [Sulfurovum sp.]|uniref:diguanylate cyclase domain-containing protein n=1 Tax=Sulfurovum sp. TaxID=1969726 RepID=UPI003562EAB1